jgi:hypothetical protein
MPTKTKTKTTSCRKGNGGEETEKHSNYISRSSNLPKIHESKNDSPRDGPNNSTHLGENKVNNRVTNLLNLNLPQFGLV